MYIPFMVEQIRLNNLNPANGTAVVDIKGFL
jgi:tRNA (Thr-GGU) A37 N-methylase